MRIALITPGFSAGEDDWAIPALLDLVRELARQHDIQVFTLRYPHRRGFYRLEGAAVHALGGAQAGGWRRLPLLARGLEAILREHRRQPFDLFHGLWADEPGLLAVTAGRLLGRPAVVSLLGGELVGFPDIGYGGQLSRANRLLALLALRAADGVTVGSRYLEQFAREHGVSSHKLTLAPLGVDTTCFNSVQTLRVSETLRVSLAGSVGDRPERETVCRGTLTRGSQPLRGEFRLLQVGSLTAVKDQAMLLQALALVTSRLAGVHLHLIGDGPLRHRLQGQAEALGLADQVTFHGHLPHSRLPSYYRHADLYVQSSRFESQGMAVLEAAACGCPVVGTAVGALPELVPADMTVPPERPAALAALLLRLAAKPDRLAELGRMAQEQVTTCFRLDHSIRCLLQLYQCLKQSR